MPRLRTLKPGFFKNELLAEVEPLGRLLFEGLWVVADRRGRLEDRPRRIKAEVLPYDDADIDDLLSQLAERHFITRYSVNGNAYIQINNFEKHQNPHVKEPPSTIPAPDWHSADPVLVPEEHSESRADIGELSSVLGELESERGGEEPFSAASAAARSPSSSKKQPSVSENFREAMREEFGSTLGDEVDHVINRALEHESAWRYKTPGGWQEHARKWLKQDAERVSAAPARASPNGRHPPPKTQQNGNYLDEYRKRRGALPWETDAHDNTESESVQPGDH